MTIRRILPWVIAALLMWVTPVFPADDGTWWKWSLATMAAANTADTVTSLKANSVSGLREANPLYGDRFTARDAGVKAGVVGGQVLLQTWLVRRWPRLARWLAVFNFSQSAVAGWAAQHNARLMP